MAQIGFTPISLYNSTTAAQAPTAGNLVNGELAINITDGKLYYKDNTGVVQTIATKAGALGDVVGPATATDNAIARFDLTTGKLIQNSGVTIDDSNNVSGVVQLNATTLDATNIEVTNLKAKDGTAAGSIADATGVVTLTTLASTTGNITTVNATTVDTTNLEVTNLKAKDGTAAGSIADSTGVVTLASSVLTTTDINGGTVDNATIGATTPSTVRATQVDIIAEGDLRLQDTTGGEFVALQAPATLASSYTLTLPVDDGTVGQALITDGSGALSWSSSASGDVYGPSSATDNAIARYDGTTGKLIQNSGVTIDDSNNVANIVNLSYTGTLTGGTGVINIGSGQLVKDASGNVGIGVTPSPNSIAKTLELQSGFNIFGYANIGYINANAYFDSGWKYKATGVAGRYEAGQSHIWFNAPSGTAGNAISFTQAMTLDASGNFGLGATPSAWGANRPTIEIGGSTQSTIAFNGNATNGGAIWTNSYFDGISPRYKANGNASVFGTSAGGFQFNLAPSGTAGNVVSFSTGAVLTSSGNFGIGTGTPASRLSSNVSGAGSITALNLTNDNGAFAAGTGTAINFGLASSNFVGEWGKIEVLNEIATSGSASYMALSTRSGDVLGQKVIIDSLGNFIINESRFFGTSNYTNKRLMNFNYPSTVGNFGYQLDCTDFGTAGTASSAVQMRITQAGNVGCRGSFVGGQTLTDYAEYFEWADGNPLNEDRIGHTVVLDEGKIRPSTSSDAPHLVIGVVSATAGVILGAAPFEWSGKYERDEFGRIKTYKENWVHWTDESGSHNYKEDEVPADVVVPQDAERKTYTKEVLSSLYDESVDYLNREHRPEWGCIGLVGQVHVKKGQLVGDRWIKMKDVSDDVAVWFIR